MNNPTLTMGSLFAGVGGFDIAAERAGIDVLWQSENNVKASAVLDVRFPHIPNYGDIRAVKIGRRKEAAPQVDILAGGFPCQSYSITGNRGGLVEDRGALWWEFHRLISEGQPAWVVGENVPGLFSSSRGRDFTTIIKSLVQLGYGVVWRVLNAEWWRVPQRRRRMFLIGYLGDKPRPEILALSESLCGDTLPSRETRQNFARTFEPGTPQVVAFSENQRGEVVETDIAHSLTSGGGKPGQGYPAVRIGTTVRKLTPLECERLMGFPDNWTDIKGNSDSQRYRQLGNAVVVPVIEWIMNRITKMGDEK